VYGVAAIVLPQAMPYTLLGNSFWTRFQMQRTNDQLTLEKRWWFDPLALPSRVHCRLGR
jgi:aspartyl protease family protein